MTKVGIPLSLNLLLYGDTSLPYEINKSIFLSVQEYFKTQNDSKHCFFVHTSVFHLHGLRRAVRNGETSEIFKMKIRLRRESNQRPLTFQSDVLDHRSKLRNHYYWL